MLALLILFSAIAVCRVRIRRFSEEALRLIDAAFAAEEGSGEAYRAACGLERLLSENKNGLMLMISHRDIAQLVSRSREACALGENAGACDLAGPLSELRTMIKLIAESNRLTIGNIL